MARTINAEPAAYRELTEFYDWLADGYDSMTGADQRSLRERPFFEKFVAQYGIRSALDAGSGTGTHALLLAQLGVRVTAVDISAAMLQKLNEKAGSLGLTITTRESSLQEIRADALPEVDAVFCLGNTLPHLSSGDDLDRVLRTMHRLLRPGGILLAQILNFDRILGTRDSLRNVRETDNSTFIRYYEFAGDAIIFNIVRTRREDGSDLRDVRSIQLLPITSDRMTQSLRAAGFSDLRFFGGFLMEEFRVNESRDLMVLAKKPTNPASGVAVR